jgi:RNA:NAD 2'-phosphotransferase (TPT1/KptA family)
MRTTLDLEPDVLIQARQIAQMQRTSIGKTVSRLLRERFQTPQQANATADPNGFVYRNGFAVLPSRGEVVTAEHVQRLMDEEGI